MTGLHILFIFPTKPQTIPTSAKELNLINFCVCNSIANFIIRSSIIPSDEVRLHVVQSGKRTGTNA